MDQQEMWFIGDSKIEPYPFEFKVVSDEEELQKQIAENPSGTVINIYVQVTITIVSLGSIVILAWYFFKKKK